MSKALIVADLKYKSPKRRGRGSGQKGLRGALKYFQYREDHNTRASKERPRDRWQDRGLGAHYREIQTNCDRLKSQHVLAWTWVVSPAPDLMALVPEERRRAQLGTLVRPAPRRSPNYLTFPFAVPKKLPRAIRK